jgi:hypothetical protein
MGERAGLGTPELINRFARRHFEIARGKTMKFSALVPDTDDHIRSRLESADSSE